jgi:hypothetical protein
VTEREDERSRGIVLAKSLRPSIPSVSNINLTLEFRASGRRRSRSRLRIPSMPSLRIASARQLQLEKDGIPVPQS